MLKGTDIKVGGHGPPRTRWLWPNDVVGRSGWLVVEHGSYLGQPRLLAILKVNGAETGRYVGQNVSYLVEKICDWIVRAVFKEDISFISLISSIFIIFLVTLTWKF